MLEYLKKESNTAHTENGALSCASTMSAVLDLFSTVGGMRGAPDEEIVRRFMLAYSENAQLALKLLFFVRDVRGGMGERRIFRVILRALALKHAKSVKKNIAHIPCYGRYDDLFVLVGTPCEEEALRLIKEQLYSDIAALKSGGEVSLLAKWMPSVNTSSRDAVKLAKKLARYLGYTDAEYRKVLSALRARIRLLENYLREKNYTFDYSKQPSKAMFKYRNAFFRNDLHRYSEYLVDVAEGRKKLNTSTLVPYEIIAPAISDIISYEGPRFTDEQKRILDATWNAQAEESFDENALVVVDGSGSMYCDPRMLPASVALSLGIYYAERNTGAFAGHFITFSETPRLVEVKGGDIYEKIRWCVQYNEVANTDLSRVFELILDTALKHGVEQKDMPSRLYVVSDMEFDDCACGADLTNFEYARQLFESHGYKLPQVVFWNVASRRMHAPVTQNEQGVALVSGCSPRIFSMLREGGRISPYEHMIDILCSQRYSQITA